MANDLKLVIYNVLADVAFENDATKEEMLEAIEWFKKKFYEFEDEE